MQENTHKTIIKPKKGWVGINFKELWLFKELFYIFSWRDIKVRYKQTAIGIIWALIQPIMLMVVFSLFFGNLIGVPSDGIPYPIFAFSGLLFWNYFSTSLTKSSNSLVENENVIKKIYFPRLILPFSASITPLIELLISFLVYAGLMLYYQYTPTLEGLLLLPLLIILSLLSASGLGSFLAAINVRYRDIREALPFFIQTLFFVTPVIYPTTLIPEKYQWILALNPMTGIIETARAGLIGNQPINYELLGISTIIAIALFILGIFYFRKTEKVFADIA
ncbi:MAG: ABC transporter permease [Candidatus Kerfeldbacteria bacterium]